RVEIIVADLEWESFTDTLAETIEGADPAKDCIAIDTISPTWESVQNWYLEQVYGHDLPGHVIELKRAHSDDKKAYHRALTDDMNWPAGKKEYARRIYPPISLPRARPLPLPDAKAVNHGPAQA